MERFAISIFLLSIGCVVVAGWAWAAVLGDSDQELRTDFETLKIRNER